MTPLPSRAMPGVGAFLARLLVVFALVLGGMSNAAVATASQGVPGLPLAEVDRAPVDGILAEARALSRAFLPGDPPSDPVLSVAAAGHARPTAEALPIPAAPHPLRAAQGRILPPVRGPPAA